MQRALRWDGILPDKYRADGQNLACKCGSAICRGRFTGNDWLLPELWERYRGHFSPYLQARINRLSQKG